MQTKKNYHLSLIQTVRIICQLVFFILLPDLFITVFTSVGEIVRAVISGSFFFSEMRSEILVVITALMLTFIWGRFFCGFMCSFGAMQDLLNSRGKHLPGRPVITRNTDRILKSFKYIILLTVIFGVWIFELPGDTLWSPWTVFGMYAVPWKGLPPAAMLLSLAGLLLMIIVIGSILVERFFCRYFCPLGAIFALVSRFRIFRLKRGDSTCSSKCRICTGTCSMSIPLFQMDDIRSGECIACMKCVNACPRKNIKAGTVKKLCIILTAVTLLSAAVIGIIPAKAADDTGTDTEHETVSSETIDLMHCMVAGTPARVSDTYVPRGMYDDGIHTGSGTGYRGTTTVSVTVENGYITVINIDSYRDDNKQFSKAQNSVIPAIINSQNTDVDTVSGATYSSRSIIEAVKNALRMQ